MVAAMPLVAQRVRVAELGVVVAQLEVRQGVELAAARLVVEIVVVLVEQALADNLAAVVLQAADTLAVVRL